MQLLSSPFLVARAQMIAGQCCLAKDRQESATLSSAAALRLSAYFRTLRVPSDAATKFAPGHTSMPAQQRL